MKQRAGFGAQTDAVIKSQRKTGHALGIKSRWDFEQWRRAGRGGQAYQVSQWSELNKVVNEGLDAALDIMFHGSTQITTWYIALFEDNHTVAAGDTYATPGYTECTAYSDGTRPVYNEAAASSQAITNSANKASFSMSTTKTIYGSALVGGGTAATTIGDTAGGGTLFAAVQFTSGSKAVENGDTLKVTITITASDQ